MYFYVIRIDPLIFIVDYHNTIMKIYTGKNKSLRHS